MMMIFQPVSIAESLQRPTMLVFVGQGQHAVAAAVHELLFNLHEQRIIISQEKKKIRRKIREMISSI